MDVYLSIYHIKYHLFCVSLWINILSTMQQEPSFHHMNLQKALMLHSLGYFILNGCLEMLKISLAGSLEFIWNRVAF